MPGKGTPTAQSVTFSAPVSITGTPLSGFGASASVDIDRPVFGGGNDGPPFKRLGDLMRSKAEEYEDLFDTVLDHVGAGVTNRPGGPVAPAPTIKPGRFFALSSAKRVHFPPLRVPLWRKNGGGLVSVEDPVRALKGAQVAVGRYMLTFAVPKALSQTDIDADSPIPVKVLGKKVVIERTQLDAKSGKLRVQVDVQENPLPLLAIAGVVGAAAAGGIGAWFSGEFSEMIESVDKVLGSVTALAIVAGVGFLAFKFLTRRKRN